MAMRIKLRYGENPHQRGWIKFEHDDDPLAIVNFRQLQGKELSFNNYLDIDATIEYLSFLGQEKPACVVVKHGNACGASINNSIIDAFMQAWDGDSLAAFGGIVGTNRIVNQALAQTMQDKGKFFEVLICPSMTKTALKLFKKKQNLRVLINDALKHPQPTSGLRSRQIRGGYLTQEYDNYRLQQSALTIMTKKKPSNMQWQDMLFAWEIARVSKANCIVLSKNLQLVSSGVGQQDRLRCCQLVVSKAGTRVNGCVAASDAFFPFADGPELLIKAGVEAIIQPGGSIRDEETIKACDKHGVSMVFTGIRCFRH